MARLLRAPLLGQVAVVTFLALVLEVVTRSRLISPITLAGPSTIWAKFWEELTAGALGEALAMTAYEMFLAFLIASFAGLSLGYLLWRFETVGRASESILGAIFSTPTVLLFPIILVFFGRTVAVPIVMGVMVGIIPIIINTRAGLCNVRGILLKLGRSLNLSNLQIFSKLLLPAAAPTIFSGIKLGLIYTMIGVTAMEFLVEIGGLGKVIATRYDTFDTPGLYTYMGMVLVVAVILVELVNRTEARIR
jgi:NitT/TauT family transport system permease protein